ncbi:hypothetical protein ABE10_01700 [Bacillus toyonensis]|nr:hypothetical protein [Bacillus toyonensis]
MFRRRRAQAVADDAFDGAVRSEGARKEHPGDHEDHVEDSEDETDVPPGDAEGPVQPRTITAEEIFASRRYALRLGDGHDAPPVGTSDRRGDRDARPRSRGSTTV